MINMSNKKVVVVLGRTSFGRTLPEQQSAVKQAAKAVADLVEAKYQIVITHSNAPQVGMVHTAMTEFSRLDKTYTVAPMSVCSAMSQGYIGYDLQNAIRSELIARGIFCPVSTLITQVRVDPFDQAFANPTKIIGRSMSEEEAKEEEKKGNHVIKEGKGYRRIVASPMPLDIYEIDAIRALSDAGQIVIAAGGGGIPVLEQGVNLKGASAVIEKDYTAEKLAELLNADTLLFLTGVEQVCLNYGQPAEQPLASLTSAEAREYIAEGHFPEHSMLPKVQSACTFVANHPERKTIITSLSKAGSAMKGRCGTVIKEG